MYPLRTPYQKIRSRLKNLISDGYPAEALVTSIFTAERLLRRTLIQMIISAGFTTENAFKIAGRLNGIQAIKDSWPLYDPRGRALVDILGNSNWQVIYDAAKMRNDMVHGSVTHGHAKCKRTALRVIETLDRIKERLFNVYGYHGWGGLKKRTVSALHTNPKISI